MINQHETPAKKTKMRQNCNAWFGVLHDGASLSSLFGRIFSQEELFGFHGQLWCRYRIPSDRQRETTNHRDKCHLISSLPRISEAKWWYWWWWHQLVRQAAGRWKNSDVLPQFFMFHPPSTLFIIIAWRAAAGDTRRHSSSSLSQDEWVEISPCSVEYVCPEMSSKSNSFASVRSAQRTPS